MYRDKYNWCECECDRLAGIEDIQKGICKIKEGIKDIEKGLDYLCSCCLREGVKCIEKGLCKIEKGLCYIMEGVKDLDYDHGCRDMRELKDAICDIKEGIKCVREGLCDVCKHRVCEGIKKIQAGLHMIEKGLCELVDSVNEILAEVDRKKKPICAEPEMRYGDRYCGSYGVGDDPTDFKF